jgi:hypothetical protein
MGSCSNFYVVGHDEHLMEIIPLMCSLGSTKIAPTSPPRGMSILQNPTLMSVGKKSFPYVHTIAKYICHSIEVYSIVTNYNYVNFAKSYFNVGAVGWKEIGTVVNNYNYGHHAKSYINVCF